jgi:hypothetical protein
MAAETAACGFLEGTFHEHYAKNQQKRRWLGCISLIGIIDLSGSGIPVYYKDEF